MICIYSCWYSYSHESTILLRRNIQLQMSDFIVATCNDPWLYPMFFWYHIAEKLAGGSLAVWRKIRKLNSANIKPAGLPLKHIRSRTVPVLQDSCILSRECDVGDPFLSKKESCVANEVCSWGSRLRPIGLTSSVSPRSIIHSREGKDGKVCQRIRHSQDLLSAWICKLPGLDQLGGLAYIVVVMPHLGVEIPNHQI